MVQNNLQAYYVPLDEEGRRSWISGFSGSNGDAIVTLDQVKSGLLVDRPDIYFVDHFRRLAGLMGDTFFKQLISWTAIGAL